MKIALDAMGGDNAPLEIVKGANLASYSYPEATICLIGDESRIKGCYEEMGVSIPSNIEIVHAGSFITMEEDPMVIAKEKKDSSISIGLNMLKENEADAFVSAGSTGAVHVASTLIVRKIKGVRRSAIAAVIPFEKPILMLDSGANPTVTADILNQWAVLGSAYSKILFKLDNPRVGLLNNGTEEHKGTPIASEAYQLLKSNTLINFVGNIESRELPYSPCDVLITDGFTGNITLKLIEGMGKLMFKSLKKVFLANIFTKLSSLAVKKQLKELKSTFDSSQYGGAPLLGLSKPVIKAHGNSKAEDIKNAVRQAIEYSQSGIIEKVTKTLS